MKSDYDTVLVIAQSMIQNQMSDHALTHDMIAAKVNLVLALDPKWQSSLDPAILVRDLETRFNIWIGRETILSDAEDHVQWLLAERMEGWRCWQRYRQFLETRWSPKSIDALDNVTFQILSLLEDPRRGGAWDRRGLVVGHVQSGKTANYIGLICKAVDAGYKLIIVLAGLHKNLRSQTQMRLDEGFLGYETPLKEADRGKRFIGVGLENPEPSLELGSITNRNNNGDFSRKVAEQFSINPGGRPLLFVVKKNASVLLNLLTWVQWSASSRDAETGRKIVANVPLLVIDDEADHASVDTGEQSFDEQGNPDLEHDPTAINGRIRRLLHSFEKSAYVGYTATPFANIFIHDRGRTDEEGEDLFPRSFIINLPVPSNYVGPVRIFGLDSNVENEGGMEPLPLVRHITDHADSPSLDERSGWIPPKHKSGHRPLFNSQDEVPPSLREAIHAFILACAARRARGQNHKHNSMLIHVTRYTNIQNAVRRQVEEEVRNIKRRLQKGEGEAPDTVRETLRRLWEADISPTTRAVQVLIDDPGITSLSWSDIEPHLSRVVIDIQVREINGSAKDILDYETHRETGLAVIAIGGDKLARGLTLEGLTVSYFLRATRMYDTLMQMGRWFGYRPGYLDLCRLYTTPDLDEWLQHITEASEELRQEFDHMVAVGGTPRDYGLKVRSHPVLMVTSSVKMRHNRELQLSFAGSVSETVVFHRDAQTIENNFRAAEMLLRRLGNPQETDPERPRLGGKPHKWSKTYLWFNVPAQEVTAWLDAVITHPSAVRVNSRLLREYIEKQVAAGELNQWTVALISGGEEGAFRIAEQDVELIKRTPNLRVPEQVQEGRYVIRRLLAPRDEAIDLDLPAYGAALQQTIQEWHEDPGRSRRREKPDTPSGPNIRRQRDPSNGLLLLYPLSPQVGNVEGELPVIGFGISFPTSPGARTVTYKVNNIYWSQEYGGDS